ncbi:urea-proton symporter dur3-like [Plakobranchus ocellatus]|uniref:Urea-proton symporter dur3-like n=1 Tax=Plakobranchus ocellatus TaxID=259542 RepID=A0AAV3YGM3_9GAST|nr:urea-proton symporter dur3-like [Plakobranchus ocellatus]
MRPCLPETMTQQPRKVFTQHFLAVVSLGLLICLLQAPEAHGLGETSHSQKVSKDGCPQLDPVYTNNTTYSKVYPVLNKHQATGLLLLGFAGLSVLLALGYVAIRKNVFHDANTLDTVFDAGGKVSTSLTAVTVASQLLWPGDLLQSATVAIKNGIAGSFWYTTCCVINMILFPVLSVQFKTRAPGAKTFLQVIYARFGASPHMVFSFFALLMNVMVFICLLTSSTALLQALVKDANGEYCMMIMATLFGSYSFVGGLGSTFYVSYFNAAVIFACLISFTVSIFYSGDNMGTADAISDLYEKVRCLEGPEGNEERSYLTFWSKGAIIWAVQGFFATASITFCDQASWQSRIAAKPAQGVLGFFAATYIWFAIPSTIGTTLGLGYLAKTSGGNQSFQQLDMADIDSGLVTVFMAQSEMGTIGSYLVLTMIIMAVMSSGSGEVMAISSIIVYDIYQIHINPFNKKKPNVSECILCGDPKRADASVLDQGEITVSSPDGQEVKSCQCPAASECEQCYLDQERIEAEKKLNKQRVYMCPHHGDYRSYLESLVSFKSWCILWVTISLVPIGLLTLVTGVDLNYVMMVGFILTTPSFPPSLMTVLWTKTSGIGVTVGSLSGFFGGIVANLIVASTFDGGLSQFLANTSQDYAVLAGSCTAFGLSLTLTIIVSLFTHKIKTPKDAIVEWQKARDIDNPLKPWSEIYREDFPHLKEGEKPSYKELDRVLRKAKLTAYIGGAISLTIFVLIIPGIMATFHVLSESVFQAWVIALQTWALLMAIVVIVMAPLEEIIIIFRQIRQNMRTAGARIASLVNIHDEAINGSRIPENSIPLNSHYKHS